MATKKEILSARIASGEQTLKVYNESPYKNKAMDTKTRKDITSTLQENKRELEDVTKLEDVNKHKKGTM